MDINDLRGLSTLMLMIAFLGVCFWAYSRKRHKAFEEAANLPFADEQINRNTQQKEADND
ncbi:MAG: CcoQ/FixQ family Cbb3-type cytochrome c oxidase assembly chaperone [Halioglobus sp.]